jgi:hypothetical protein
MGWVRLLKAAPQTHFQDSFHWKNWVGDGEATQEDVKVSVANVAGAIQSIEPEW